VGEALRLGTTCKIGAGVHYNADAAPLCGAAIHFNEVSWQNFHSLLRRYGLTVLREELRTLLAAATAVPELSLNRKAYSDFKKRIMPRLSG
jgi:hypothetical protein